LIGFYLKVQRSGEASLEAPSIQNFKQELKNLASMIGDLQTPTAIQAPAQNQTHTTPQMPAEFPTKSKPTAMQAKPLPVTGLPQHTIKESDAPAGHNSNQSAGPNLGALDAQSQLCISEIRETLNLSSDAEALRAIIALGYRSFKKI
jgi:hypothetical protein